MRLPEWTRVPGKSLPATASVSFLSLLLLLISCTTKGNVVTGTSTGTTGTGTALQTQWVVGWGAPVENATTSTLNPGGSEQSFRFVVIPTTDGTQERVHFSNTLGKGPVTIGSARLAAVVGVGPAIDATRDASLTFSSSPSVTIPAGQEVVSDPVNVTYAFGEELAVSVYVKGSFGSLPQHGSDSELNFKTSVGAGDKTTDSTGSSFGTTLTEWLMVTGIDVYGSFQGTVAVFGSSSIDGHASNTGDTNSYPVANVAIPTQTNDRPSDWLARQLRTAGYRMGVLNAGAIGDPAAENAMTAAGTAIAGVDRMQHDVLQQAGIKTVVIYFGGIDLRSDCKPATDVEASLTNMVQQAHTAGVRVILATLPPSEYCQYSDPALLPSSTSPYAGDLYPGPENPGSTQRRQLNDWIRSTAINLPGVVAIADFDKALASTVHPDFMIPNLNSGDNFHPNGTGYGVQSSAIPLDSILGP